MTGSPLQFDASGPAPPDRLHTYRDVSPLGGGAGLRLPDRTRRTYAGPRCKLVLLLEQWRRRHTPPPIGPIAGIPIFLGDQTLRQRLRDLFGLWSRLRKELLFKASRAYYSRMHQPLHRLPPVPASSSISCQTWPPNKTDISTCEPSPAPCRTLLISPPPLPGYHSGTGLSYLFKPPPIPPLPQ